MECWSSTETPSSLIAIHKTLFAVISSNCKKSEVDSKSWKNIYFISIPKRKILSALFAAARPFSLLKEKVLSKQSSSSNLEKSAILWKSLWIWTVLCCITYLDIEKLGPEKLPLSCAIEVNSDTIMHWFASQGCPLFNQTWFHFWLFGIVLVTWREKLFQCFWGRLFLSSKGTSTGADAARGRWGRFLG